MIRPQGKLYLHLYLKPDGHPFISVVGYQLDDFLPNLYHGTMLGRQKSPSIKKNGLALGVSGLAKPLDEARHGSCIAYMLF